MNLAPPFAHTSPPNSTPSSAVSAPLTTPLAAILRELGAVVASASPHQYTQCCGEQFFDATIGGHVRHCLDHVRALADGRLPGDGRSQGWGEINYDHRERGTPIETSIDAATAEIAALVAALERLADTHANQRLRVSVMPARDSQAFIVESTLGRELSFVLSHTIHHNAMVRGMALAVGVPVPLTFGYAPSTLAQMDPASCVR